MAVTVTAEGDRVRFDLAPGLSLIMDHAAAVKIVRDGPPGLHNIVAEAALFAQVLWANGVE